MVATNNQVRWSVDQCRVDHPDAHAMLRLYFGEMVGRYVGRAASADEVEAAMAEDPSTDLAPPSGVFLVASRAGQAVGCAGLRRSTGDIAEMTRVFIHPDWRGTGGGAALIAAIEQAAHQFGATRVRLDTRSDLVEARGLYAKNGYVEIPAYNDGPYAEHWFEKQLAQA